MPEPGSHAYDVQRARLRDEIDNSGNPDANATDAANRELRGDSPVPSPHAETERAGGPLGQRDGGGGDPGNVIGLRSEAFSDGSFIPGEYAKDGGNQQPVLEWDDVPDGTTELALLCVDPDAPVGTWLHWLVTGIDPSTRRVEPGADVGIEHGNGYGEQGWGGPQPPVGDEPHRYVFRLYALAEPFAAPDPSDADAVRSWLDDHSTATGTLTGRYQR
ncbi:YbhB/YbcL family Raf kinase inhibitor-like protein [Motilibacter deserti]|uniref:YbhB/YbcL family Raf kinase inhibitor-like protein n=1 Tax=Motilibacter deserti TaxID=2714956 RepID=A0ABX0GVP8_9ACTN|nr:YbhB/YbcL family Raf kinase inhibitor-like protein [Motilibacter deserti]NHC14588.1 YbhB/YbcL family Raf kinase inhibitor-like protein [Motilibacter deserti]